MGRSLLGGHMMVVMEGKLFRAGILSSVFGGRAGR